MTHLKPIKSKRLKIKRWTKIYWVTESKKKADTRLRRNKPKSKREREREKTLNEIKTFFLNAKTHGL